MQAPKLLLLSLLVLSLSSLHLPGASAADPLYTLCSDSAGNYSTPSWYADNLQTLANTLVSRAESGGFGSAIAWAGESTSYGIALCRGDAPYYTCRACVTDAANELRRACPVQKEASIWYDNCMVRYAARNIIGTMDDGFRVFMWNTEVVPEPAAFNAKVVNLLKRVSSEAYGNLRRLYGAETADVVVSGKKEKLYSLAQCTRDIKAEECRRCLEDIMAEYPNYFDGKRGGRVLTASCNFRYELYRFYD